MRADSPPADLPALTSLRFFAAGMIFVFHLREYAPSDWAAAAAPAMYHGVSFFFVLSGFVLTHVYAGRDVSWRRFYRARLARLAPLHLATLALLAAAIPMPYAVGQKLDPGGAALALALKAAMLDAWVPTRGVLQSWNNVSWSISAEMAFYAAFPLLLAAMTRRPAAKLAAAATLAGVAAVSLAVFAVGAATLPVFAADRNAPSLFDLGSCFPLARGFEFALGMATCLAWRRWQAATLPAPLSTAIEAAALAGAVAWLALGVPWLVRGAEGALYVWLRACGSCGAFALLIAALAAGRGGLGRLLSWRPLVALGEASFAFYMVHMIVMRGLRFHFGWGPGALAALALSLALAFGLHHAVEIPMRRRILAAPAPAPAPVRLAHPQR